MIVPACNNCESVKLEKYKGKMAEKGYDWVHCNNHGNNFPLRKVSYRQERTIFD